MTSDNRTYQLQAYRAEIIDPRKQKTALANRLLLRLDAPFAGGRPAVAVDGVGDIIAMDWMGHPGEEAIDF